MKKTKPKTVKALPPVSPFPVGTILALAGNTLPAGWLLCDGSPIPKTYIELITNVGANTPNLVGRTLIGAGTNPSTAQTDGLAPNFTPAVLKNIGTINQTGGECTHVLVTKEIPAHTHSINNGDFGTHWRSFSGTKGSDRPFEISPSFSLNGTDSTGGDAAHNTMPPYYTIRYIIYAGS